MEELDIKLKKLHLKGYRGFLDSGEIELHNKVNIFIGENGSGKTSLLEAARRCLMVPESLILSRSAHEVANLIYREEKNGGLQVFINENNIHLDEKTATVEACFKPLVFDTSLEFAFSYGRKGSEFGEVNSVRRKIIDSLFPKFKDFESTVEQIRNSEAPNLPLLLFNNASSSETISSSGNMAGNSFEGYSDGLSGTGLSLASFKKWFTWQENLSRQHEEYNKVFEVVCKAIYKLLSDENQKYHDLFTDWQRDMNGEVMIHKNGEPLPLSFLSSGEQTLLRLVTGIVWRIHTLNPGRENPLEGKGILLIDEIDLHLHPRWQQKVIEKLTKLFPNLQILLTTHSPFILQRLGEKDGRVFQIENFRVKQVNTVKYWSLQNILTDVQHTESEAVLRQRLLKKAFELLDKEQLEALKSEFSELEKQLPPDDKDLLFLKNEIDFLEAEQA